MDPEKVCSETGRVWYVRLPDVAGTEEHISDPRAKMTTQSRTSGMPESMGPVDVLKLQKRAYFARECQ